MDELKTVAPLQGAALRAHALGDRATRWKHEIIEWEGQSYLVRAPSVAAQRKILSHMPEQKAKASQLDGDEDAAADIDVTIPLTLGFDMKVERLIQCLHDLKGQRLFNDADRPAIEQWPADDGLLTAVSDAVERLTKKGEAQGKASGGAGTAAPSSASPAK